MDYGVTFTGVGPMADPEKLRRLTRKAEHLGFKSVWLYDHVTFPGKAPDKSPFTPETPFLSPVTTLAFLAAETKQIRLGTGVLLVALRHPLLIAKDVATLDVISGGRAILGLGLGWLEPEFQALAIPFNQRVGRVKECVEILRNIWATGKFSYDGKYFQFAETTSFPMPIQAGGPPIWFGGGAEPALKRASEIGDGWLGVGGPVESVAKRIRKVVDYAKQAQRKDFVISVGASPDATRDEISTLQAAGAQLVNLSFASGEVSEIENKMEAAAARLFS